MSTAGDLSRLRELIARGAYEEALALVDNYSSAVEHLVAARPPGDREALRAVEEALQLLGWARRVIAADRLRSASTLARLESSRRYRTPPLAAPRWRLDC